MFSGAHVAPGQARPRRMIAGNGADYHAPPKWHSNPLDGALWPTGPLFVRAQRHTG